MAIEIERKFLVTDDGWRTGVVRSERLVQGYLGAAQRCSVRVRIGQAQAWLNVKSALPGIERIEFEYAIPRDDAEQMLDSFCAASIAKIRHHVPHGGLLFEVDEFLGASAGLVVAEVELAQADAAIARPAWLGREVSDRPRYYNLHLLEHPYSTWNAAERAGD